MATLYEVLEVSENASNEVIEKAYKVLVKKYHPDLQEAKDKEKFEEKMKKINDAYDILINEEKRRKYDEELLEKRKQKELERLESIRRVENQKQNTYQDTNYYKNNYNNIQRSNQGITSDMQRRYEEQLRKEQEVLRMQMQQSMEQEYQNAYYSYLRNLGYKIKYKWTWEKTKKLLVTISIMIAIFALLWIIPPTHNIMLEFYNNNIFVKIIVDIFITIIKAIWEAITGIFTKK